MSLAATLALGACRPKPEPAASAHEVSVVEPERRDLERTIEVPGDVRAYFQATLLAQVAGYVTEVRFDKGDLVKKGDVIATVDVPELEAERVVHSSKLEQARAALRRATVLVDTARAGEQEAQANLEHAEALANLEISLHERAKQLRADNDISIQDLEVAAGKREAAVAERSLAKAKVVAAHADVERAETEVSVQRANVDAEQAALREVEARLGYASVRAPFDGVVTARFVDPGALIQRATRSAESAQPIVTVATRGRVRVDFELPESEVAFCHSGTLVELRTAAYRQRRFSGTVTRVASALSPETRTMLCEAELPNDDDALLPGMYATVHVVLEKHPGALVLPPEAISERAPRSWVFTVEGDTVERKPVEKGWDFGQFVEIAGGLTGREHVVLGAGELQPGETVRAQLVPWSSESGRKSAGEGEARPKKKREAAREAEGGSTSAPEERDP